VLFVSNDLLTRNLCSNLANEFNKSSATDTTSCLGFCEPCRNHNDLSGKRSESASAGVPSDPTLASYQMYGRKQ